MKDNVVSLLEERGVKPTSNRIIVLRALLEADGPRTLMELEHQIDTLDKSSVFRVLDLLLKHGVVHVSKTGAAAPDMSSATATMPKGIPTCMYTSIASVATVWNASL